MGDPPKTQEEANARKQAAIDGILRALAPPFSTVGTWISIHPDLLTPETSRPYANRRRRNSLMRCNVETLEWLSECVDALAEEVLIRKG